MSKHKKTIDELLIILQQDIIEYEAYKTEECLKKLRKTCRAIISLTVNPTTPPPKP